MANFFLTAVAVLILPEQIALLLRSQAKNFLPHKDARPDIHVRQGPTAAFRIRRERTKSVVWPIERLLALHRADRLTVLKLGSDYSVDTETVERGALVTVEGEHHGFEVLMDATGQQAVSAWDVPFPSLIEQGIVREALTETATSPLATSEDTAVVATGGIDLDESFRPKFDKPLCRNLYCISIPFLLHKLPFVQGITSAHALGQTVAPSILESAKSRESLSTTFLTPDVDEEHIDNALA